MSNVKKLHNKTLYRVDLDVTQRYGLYFEAVTLADLDNQVRSVVDDDTYSLATHDKPKVVRYDYSSKYITCEQSFEDFNNGNLD